MSLVQNPQKIRLGIAGMVPENGHPFSWSAILNGYEPLAMAECGYPAIPAYLARQPESAFGVPGARVTHVWCDEPADAACVARASKIPHVVHTPESMIAHVDAVLIPTDVGSEHLERARVFIDAGLPVFIDKPLTDRPDHLAVFERWVESGAAVMAGSAMRYSSRFAQLRQRFAEVGELRAIHMTMCKDWARYGIHALEGIYPTLAPGGWESVQMIGRADQGVARLKHNSGVEAIIHMVHDLYGAMGQMTLHGTAGSVSAKFDDSFGSFKAQLADFVSFLQTGRRPYAFSETVELTLMVIAGLDSITHGGREVALAGLRSPLTETYDAIIATRA